MKLTKKELKAPDRVWQASRETLDFMTKNVAVIVILLVFIFAGTIGGVYFYQSKMRTEGKAQAHYGEAKALFEQWKIQVGMEKGLDKAGEKTKGVSAPSKEEQKKTEADLQKEFQILDSDFKNSHANQLAQMIRGQMSAFNGKWPEAVAAYEIYSKSLPSSEKALGLYPLAQAYEQSGNLEKALATHDQILKIKDSPYQEWSMLAKGRLLRSLKRNDEAKKVYEVFLEKFPNSTEVSIVRGLLIP
ncbi:MAG: tetratricopeptide repeat protein [Deltaproteobacteria bacterium]|nr:tetratricopeptide repeat protein [Deltaproteobacteria bacterium]